MKMPSFAAPALHQRTTNQLSGSENPGLQPQGCSVWEWAGCAGAIAGCATLSGPALVACVAAAAPNCLKCL